MLMLWHGAFHQQERSKRCVDCGSPYIYEHPTWGVTMCRGCEGVNVRREFCIVCNGNPTPWLAP